MPNENEWLKVVLAADCVECSDCDEPVCPVCVTHYADCACPGPTQDGYEYEEREDGLWAREIADEASVDSDCRAAEER